jgi:hypothetical protein
VQSLRRWVPGPARDALPTATPAVGVRSEEAAAKDIAFCSELAFHGGVAVSEKGFKAEGELVRMRQAGLLDLERDVVPPFAVTRVALSHTARQMLSGPSRVLPGGGGKDARENAAGQAVTALDPKQEMRLRCNGFEVARGMISAAVKAELASWYAAGGKAGTAELEGRLLMRINKIVIPFPS